MSSNLPVILYDRHDRYIHFKSKQNTNFDIISYVVKKNELKKKIDKIYLAPPKNYHEVNYNSSIKRNVTNLVKIMNNQIWRF